MTDGPSAAQVTGGAPSGFPRIYYVSPGWRVLLCALSALLLAGALAAIVFGAILHDGATAQAKAIIMAIGIGLAAASIYAFVATLMSRVVLYADTVEMVGLVRRRRARRADIVGRRFHAMPYNLPPTLVLTTNNGKNLNISGFMSGDAVLREWVASIRDLDAKDAQDTLVEIADDERLGRTPEERLRRIGRARTVARAFNIGSYALCVWALFYPRPYAVAVAAMIVLPIAAILLIASQPAIYGAKRNTIVTPLFVPGLVLVARAYLDVNLLDWATTLMAATTVGILLAALTAALIGDVQRRLQLGLIYLVATVPYAYGTMAVSDMLLDSSPSETFAAYLQDKRVHAGRYTTYELRLAPWGRQNKPTDVTVPQVLFDAVKPGDKVSVYLQQGALGFPWYFTGSCAVTFIPPTVTALDRILDGEVAYRCGRYDAVVRALGDLAKSGNAQAQVLVGLAHWEERSPLKDRAEAMRLFRLAAAQGNARAMNVIGFSYQHGIGVPADPAEAVAWYAMAAKRDELRALNNLGIAYHDGIGFEKDSAAARQYWHRSAELGHDAAMNNLGNLYAEGDDLSRNMPKAIEWWAASAERGNSAAQYALAREYHLGENLEQDNNEALGLLERSAEGGFAPAARMLAEFYRDGDIVRKSTAEAVKWYAKAFIGGDVAAAFDGAALADGQRDPVQATRLYQSAAQAGNARAQALLGQRYFTGIGVARDETEALKWFRMSADQGDAYGEFYLGEIYYVGSRTVARDRLEAASWYLRAAERGLAAAQSRLGLLYVSGELSDRDLVAAVKWFRLAAEQEYPEAMNSLGHALDTGAGVERNPAEAEEWFRRASAYGYPNAMHNLATRHIRGDTGAVDLGEAYYWLLLAERFYTERDSAKRAEAVTTKNSIEARLSDDVRSDARDRARRFKPNPNPPPDGARPSHDAANR